MTGTYNMICASITESSMEKAVRTANNAPSDLAEIRLDYLREFETLKELEKVKKPVVATCMPVWEGGRFAGTEAERVRILREAAEYSDYVSIELRTEKKIRYAFTKEASEKEAKVIVSCHDFEKTPESKEITKILKEEEAAGADIAKIAFCARDYADVLRTMEPLLDKSRKIPIIAISMGEYGRISRILGPLLGSYMTFASPVKGREAAPGQLSVEELKKVLSILGR